MNKFIGYSFLFFAAISLFRSIFWSFQDGNMSDIKSDVYYALSLGELAMAYINLYLVKENNSKN